MENKIARKNNKLHEITSTYHPIIKKRYLESNLPSNTVYFAIAPTGFLYNAKKIKISQKDSIEKIFKHANKNIIAIVDDEIEANHFIASIINKKNKQNENLNAISSYSTWKIFEKLFKGKRVFITNNLDRIVADDDFAFSFTWSGEAIQEIKKSKKDLKFFVHPKLSYLTADLLSALNEKKRQTVLQTICQK